MAYTDYEWDGGMSNENNYIELEEVAFDPTATICVVPINNAFFLESLKVEGLLADQELEFWQELHFSADWFSSPLFLDPTASTGREIVSYFVVTRSDISRLRFSYHTVGAVQDTLLLASLAELEFDRTDKLEWGKIQGNAKTFAPMVRNVDADGRTVSENLIAGLELLRIAIANPHSGNAISAQDVTNLFIELGTKASIKQLENIQQVSTGTQYVEADTNREIYRFITDYNYVSGELIFRSNDNEFESVSFKAITNDESPQMMAYGRLSSTVKSMFTFDINKFGLEYRITATADREGDFIIKLYSQFM